MAGKGPPPKKSRRRRNTPARGEWKPAPGIGWQHGKIPPPPTGLKEASRTAWRTWMKAWFAAYWMPSDIPGLRRLILLFDEVERGEFQHSAQLRIFMDTYGITPKGQQDRRWVPPKAEKDEDTMPPASGGRSKRYGHLKVVDSA